MNRIVKRLLFVVVGAVLMVAVAAALGARINSSRSFPLGIYWTVAGTPEKGDLVIFCPPVKALFDIAQRRNYIGPGFCDGGYGYMIKRILAAKNDHISIDQRGVFINGLLVPRSRPFSADSVGRAMPRITIRNYQLANSEVLLLSDFNPKSFDARYFGVVNKSQIRSVIRPVFTW